MKKITDYFTIGQWVEQIHLSESKQFIKRRGVLLAIDPAPKQKGSRGLVEFQYESVAGGPWRHIQIWQSPYLSELQPLEAARRPGLPLDDIIISWSHRARDQSPEFDKYRWVFSEGCTWAYMYDTLNWVTYDSFINDSGRSCYDRDLYRLLGCIDGQGQYHDPFLETAYSFYVFTKDDSISVFIGQQGVTVALDLAQYGSVRVSRQWAGAVSINLSDLIKMAFLMLLQGSK